MLVVALVIGSGVLSSSPPTAAQRAAAIESSLRCPSCEDLSVAESSASTAVTVRATVTQLIAEGRTDQQIESYLVDRYGSSIVLDPPASGWSLLVWLLPLVGGLAAVAVAGSCADPAPATISRRRTRRRARRLSRPRSAPGGRGARRFLVQSLADADAEYLAGDLSDKDYLALRHRDMVRLAVARTTTTAEAEVGDGPLRSPASVIVADGPSIPPGPRTGDGGSTRRRSMQSRRRATPSAGRSRRSWWFLGGAVAAFAAALILAVSLFATDRQPGQSVTGSFAETPQQQIDEIVGPGGHRREPGPARPGRPALPVGADQAPRQRGGHGPAGLARVRVRPAGRQRAR